MDLEYVDPSRQPAPAETIAVLELTKIVRTSERNKCEKEKSEPYRSFAGRIIPSQWSRGVDIPFILHSPLVMFLRQSELKTANWHEQEPVRQLHVEWSEQILSAMPRTFDASFWWRRTSTRGGLLRAINEKRTEYVKDACSRRLPLHSNAIPLSIILRYLMWHTKTPKIANWSCEECRTSQSTRLGKKAPKPSIIDRKSVV